VRYFAIYDTKTYNQILELEDKAARDEEDSRIESIRMLQ